MQSSRFHNLRTLAVRVVINSFDSCQYLPSLWNRDTPIHERRCKENVVPISVARAGVVVLFLNLLRNESRKRDAQTTCRHLVCRVVQGFVTLHFRHSQNRDTSDKLKEVHEEWYTNHLLAGAGAVGLVFCCLFSSNWCCGPVFLHFYSSDQCSVQKECAKGITYRCQSSAWAWYRGTAAGRDDVPLRYTLNPRTPRAAWDSRQDTQDRMWKPQRKQLCQGQAVQSCVWERLCPVGFTSSPGTWRELLDTNVKVHERKT